jgi:hypothetical protein
MKTPKLIRTAKRYFNVGKRQKEAKYIKELLKKLKKKERGLKAKLGKEKEPKKRRQIRKALNVICAQRKKGVALLKDLRKK